MLGVGEISGVSEAKSCFCFGKIILCIIVCVFVCQRAYCMHIHWSLIKDWLTAVKDRFMFAECLEVHWKKKMQLVQETVHFNAVMELLIPVEFRVILPYSVMSQEVTSYDASKIFTLFLILCNLI